MTRKTTTSTSTDTRTTRDVLSRKWRRTRDYQLLVRDPADAARKLEDAKATLRTAVALMQDDDGGADEKVQRAEAAKHQAEQDLAACYEPITFQAVSAGIFQDLIREHPPTKEQQAEGAEWNPDTFQTALIAACARDIRLTPEQWAERFEDDAWSLGDRNAIFAAALAPNLAS